MITTAIETITPEIAAKWLDDDAAFEALFGVQDPTRKNRAVRKAHVQRLAASMINGQWETTPQGISFADTGRLLDGRHRLNAVKLSGKTVKIVVSRGWSESTFKKMDREVLPRSTADALGLDRKDAEVARIIAMISKSKDFVTKASDSDIEQHYAVFAEDISIINNAYSTRTNRTSAVIRAAAVASLTMHFLQRDYVIATYTDMAGFNVEGSKLALKFISQLEKGIASTRNYADLFARAIFLLDPHNRNCLTIRVDSIPAQVDRARQAIVSRMIGNKE